jgi:serine phosphatase RsbU (regulator of sigma subunit)/CHASE2 domain-containing sensor protein
VTVRISLRRSLPFLFVRLLPVWPVAVVLSALVYASALKYHWFSSVDYRVYDLGIQMKSSPERTGDVVVVAIDRSSLENCFVHPAFPISQHLSQHAKVIRRLDSAGAAVIVLDLLFDQLDTSDADQLNRFTSVVNKTNKVILATSIETHKLKGITGGQVITEKRLALPPTHLRSAASDLGLADVPLDPDGVIRRCYYGKQFQDRYIPSLSHVAAAQYANKRLLTSPTDSTFFIDYSLLNLVARISYEQVLSGVNWQRAIRDKIAIVGLTENGSIDNHLTPVSARGQSGYSQLSGVEIQAVALETLLSEENLIPLKTSYALFGGLVLLVIFGYIAKKLGAVFSTVATLLVLLVLVVGGLMSVAGFSIFLPVGPLILGIVSIEALTLIQRTTLLRNAAFRAEELLKDIQTDLSEAAPIQKNLQPTHLPTSDDFEIAALQVTCRAVGGDYYDFVEFGSDKLGILIADVSGKGVPGALIMANVQAKFRDLARLDRSPAEVLAELNKTVIAVGRSQFRFITLFYGVLDYATLDLEYGNAGHCYPIVCSAQGEVTFIQEGDVPIGLLDSAKWQNYHTTLNPGDVFCLYTDGVTEAGSADPTMQFGQQRLADRVRESRHEKAEDVKKYIHESCRQFVGKGQFDDDWTLIVIKLR